MKNLTPALCLAMLFGGASHAAEPTQAEALFSQYQSLARAYDPAVADLYCDTALIRNVRTFPSGEKKTLELPAPKYKELIRSVMPIAKARNDYSTYSQVRFIPEGSNMRIMAARHSALKDHTSPVSILIGQCGGTEVRVLEELSESVP